MRLRFLGANRQVTGSRYLLEAGGKRLLIDCGMFQEREFQSRNWDPCPEPAESIDTVLLTHAHLDHVGLLPKLVREGFPRTPAGSGSNPSGGGGGHILATAPSVELAGIVLRDSARIQEEDAEFKAKRHAREGRADAKPALPLYTVADAEAAIKLLRTVPYDQPVPVAPGVSVTWHDAGHILGSAMLEVVAREDGRTRRLIFSGDIGQWSKPLIRDPSLLERADAVIMESTYGDRDHEKPPDLEAAIGQIVNDAARAGGNLLVPTFAIERPQELIWYLNRLLRAKRIPRLMVFLDSPMAVDATQVYERNRPLLDDQTQAELKAGRDPLRFPSLVLARSREESKAINHVRGTAIIMAGSGMCTGGRIKHHLAHNLERPEATVLFVGYQAEGTLGRELVDGAKEVRVLGEVKRVRCRVRQLQGLSAHADRSSLLRWVNHFSPPPGRVFLTHGEESASLKLAETLRAEHDWNVTVPAYGEWAEI